MPDINYKAKYQELKQKFIDSVDTAFRLGYEQGQHDMQLEQLQAQTQASEAAAQENPEETPQSNAPEGSELDQHINQLEQALGKSEFSDKDLENIKKSFKSLKDSLEIKKSDQAVKGIVKALNKSSIISQKAAINLDPSAKAAVSMQHKIVEDIMKAWDDQEISMPKTVGDILSREGLTKK